MFAYLLSQLQSLMQTARDTYGVDPIVFLVIYLVCAPFWYLSLFRSLRALTMRRMSEVMLWSTIFLITSVAPFVYVMLFGRNLPVWVYAIILALVFEGVWTLVRRLRSGNRVPP
jgi:hypothetical protein